MSLSITIGCCNLLFGEGIKRLLLEECNLCIKMSYCPAVKSILEGKKTHPDCFACGRCIGICPEKALRFVKKNTLAKAC